MTGRAVRVDVRMMIATWPADAGRGAVTAFCREHQVSRSRFYEIRRESLERGALAAVAPPARPRQRPDRAVSAVVEAAAVRIRKELAEQGWDHGPLSVRQQMLRQGLPAPSRATLARIFTRHGMVTPQPRKRPRSSWRRFTFAQVHQCWQLDATEWSLADGGRATVFQLLDDHSRFIVGSWVAVTETSAAAVAVMTTAVAAHQPPQLLLTDNGRAMNPHRLGLGSQLVTYAQSLGTRAITSRVYHPQTCGKNERVHATLKRWLRARPRPLSLAELTALVTQFDDHYNHHRPHQALQMATPAHVLRTGPHATPPEPPEPPARPARPARPDRPATPHSTTVRRVHTNGSVKISGGYWIGLGVEHAGSDVLAIVENTAVAIFDAHGTHLRTVQLNPAQRYYGTGRPRFTNPRPRLNARIKPDNHPLSGPTETSPSAPN